MTETITIIAIVDDLIDAIENEIKLIVEQPKWCLIHHRSVPTAVLAIDIERWCRSEVARV